MLEKYLTWFKAHERAIIIVVVLGFGAHMYGRWIDLQSSKKEAQVAALTQAVAQDKANVASLALQASQAQAAYQTTLDAITKQNASLSAAVQADAALLAKNQAVDKGLALPDVAKRIEVLSPGAAGGITATSNGLTLNDTASHSVVDTLENVPALKSQVDAESQMAFNSNMALGKANDALNACTSEVGALNKSMIDQQAHEAAAVAAEKINTKKAWRSGFKWGFGLGFAAGAYIVHAL